MSADEPNSSALEEVETGTPVEEVVEESQKKDETKERPKLNNKNWINLASFILNLIFTYGVGNAGWFGNPNNGELSRKYQTLVTPSSSAFIIWAVIFVFQGIWAVIQMLPRYRASPMVQQGVGYWYMLVALFQIGWTFAFAFEVITLAMILIWLIWASLVGIIYSQYYTESNGSLVEFWFFRFPFALHCGWLTAASVLNINVQVVDANAPADVQLAVGIVSLAYLHAVSVWVLFGFKRPNYTIAGVLSWANGWIYSELQNPQESIVQLFDEQVIYGVSYAAAAVAFIIAGQMVVRFGIFVVQKFRSKKTDDDEKEKEHLVEDQV